jgi:hypothetical protein
VKGNPPLTRAVVENLIGYFNWLLQITRPGDQRQFIQSSLVTSWQTDNRDDTQRALTFTAAYQPLSPMLIIASAVPLKYGTGLD